MLRMSACYAWKRALPYAEDERRIRLSTKILDAIGCNQKKIQTTRVPCIRHKKAAIDWKMDDFKRKVPLPLAAKLALRLETNPKT